MPKPTILIVDDEPLMLDSLSLILEDEFNVLTATVGRKALSIIKTKTVSLILTDLHMPGMSGVELLEHVRSSNSKIPIIVMTGNSCHEWAMRCADLNIQGYVVKKPVGSEELVERIRKILGIEECEVLRAAWGEAYHARKAALSPVVKKAVAHIRRNYHQRIGRDEIGTHLNICPDYLSRKFHSDCGMHLVEYINRVRICRSMELLRDGNNSLHAITESVGISDTTYFHRLFKKNTGVTPEEFRS